MIGGSVDTAHAYLNAHVPDGSRLMHSRTRRPTSLLEDQIARRRFPRVTRQLWLLLQRGTIKYIRAFWPLRIIDSLLLLVAAFIIGEREENGWTRAP